MILFKKDLSDSTSVNDSNWNITIDRLADMLKKELYQMILNQPSTPIVTAMKIDRSASVSSLTHSGISRSNSSDSISKLRSWLKPVKMEREIEDIRKRRQHGTRTWIIDEIKNWFLDNESSSELDKRFLWLAGAAGSGKSVIAASVYTELKNLGILAGWFFCSYGDDDRCTVSDFIQTIAYQMCLSNSKIRDELVEVMENDPQITDEPSNIVKFEELILNPLRSYEDKERRDFQFNGSSASDFKMPQLVFIIDAVDEVGTAISKNREDMLALLENDFVHVPSFVKLFVSSRLQDDIKDSKIYSTRIIQDVYSRLDIPVTPELSAEIEQKALMISKKSNGLFLWLKLLERGLKSSMSPLDLLEAESSSSQISSAIVHVQMDSTYERILKEAFDSSLSVGLNQNSLESQKALKNILGIIVCSKEPLRIDDVALILDIRKDTLRIYILWLRALLDVIDGEIHFIHKSVVDFLTDPERCTDERFQITPAIIHHLLASKSLKLMQSFLKYNICKIEPTQFCDEIKDLEKQIKHVIPPHISYACKYWVHHLFETSRDINLLSDETYGMSLIDAVFLFCNLKLLNWMEALFLLKEGRDSIEATCQLELWSEEMLELLTKFEAPEPETKIAVTKPEPRRKWWKSNPFTKIRKSSEEKQSQKQIKTASTSKLTQIQTLQRQYLQTIRDLSHDSHHIIREVFPAISPNGPRGGSPLHIYHSAIPFCPTNTALYKIYQYQLQRDVKIPTIIQHQTDWGSCLATLEGHSGAVWDVAFTPDGTMVATAGDDGSIKIWDAASGEVIRSIGEAHVGPVGCLTWTAAGMKIVSGGDDAVIKLWDEHSGDLIVEMSGHDGR
ncbi:hypothetical protein HK096_010944, partial [Nowakowskiella sp. JEL0078]